MALIPHLPYSVFTVGIARRGGGGRIDPGGKRIRRMRSPPPGSPTRGAGGMGPQTGPSRGEGGCAKAAHTGRKLAQPSTSPAARRRRRPFLAAAIFVAAAAHERHSSSRPQRACAPRPGFPPGAGAARTCPQQRWRSKDGGGDRLRGGKRIAPASSPCGPPSCGPPPPRLQARPPAAPYGSNGAVTDSRAPHWARD